MDHRDESGDRCTIHAAVPEERVLELATLGSRMSGFHHDSASKMQSLMMALDEISDLIPEGQSDLRSAVDTAHMALRELHTLFTANRALAKPPQRSRVPLRDVIARAAERVGVKLRGEAGGSDVRVTVSALTHAIAMLLDLAAGPMKLGRAVDVTVAVEGAQLTLVLSGPPGAAAKPPATTNELIALAAFVIGRDEGELRCGVGGERFTLRLPIGFPTSASAPLAKF